MVDVAAFRAATAAAMFFESMKLITQLNRRVLVTDRELLEVARVFTQSIPRWVRGGAELARADTVATAAVATAAAVAGCVVLRLRLLLRCSH